MRSVPEPLAKAFAEKVTISSAELCALIPMDRGALRRHIRAGRIEYVQTGAGERSARRFTLEAVLGLLEARSGRACQSSSPRPLRRTATPTESEGSGILVRLAARQLEKQRRKGAR